MLIKDCKDTQKNHTCNFFFGEFGIATSKYAVLPVRLLSCRTCSLSCLAFLLSCRACFLSCRATAGSRDICLSILPGASSVMSGVSPVMSSVFSVMSSDRRESRHLFKYHAVCLLSCRACFLSCRATAGSRDICEQVCDTVCSQDYRGSRSRSMGICSAPSRRP